MDGGNEGRPVVLQQAFLSIYSTLPSPLVFVYYYYYYHYYYFSPRWKRNFPKNYQVAQLCPFSKFSIAACLNTVRFIIYSLQEQNLPTDTWEFHLKKEKTLQNGI